MTILIADDQPIIRVSLQLTLNQLQPQARLIECESFPEVLTRLDQQAVDLIVLDIDMPGSEKSQMMKLIKEKNPSVLILIYSGLDEQVYALPYIKAGADGYLSKNAPFAHFEVAISALLKQGKYVSPAVHQLLLASLSQQRPSPADNPLQALSNGERKVLSLIAEGKWTKDIADTLQLKQTTISTYKRKIFEKFGVSSTAELLQKLNLLRHL